MPKVAVFLASFALSILVTWAGEVLDEKWLLITGLVLLALSAVVALADWRWGMIKNIRIIGNRSDAPVGGDSTFISAEGDIEGLEVRGNRTNAKRFMDTRGGLRDVVVTDNDHAPHPESDKAPRGEESRGRRKYFSGWSPPDNDKQLLDQIPNGGNQPRNEGASDNSR